VHVAYRCFLGLKLRGKVAGCFDFEPKPAAAFFREHGLSGDLPQDRVAGGEQGSGLEYRHAILGPVAGEDFRLHASYLTSRIDQHVVFALPPYKGRSLRPIDPISMHLLYFHRTAFEGDLICAVW
jgi:hypothetical protein